MAVIPRLLVATRSSGKQPEIETILSDIPYEIVFPDAIGVAECPEEHALEDADTFAENAAKKAAYFARLSGLPTAADDSGIEVFSLGGMPGVRSKRFADPAPDQDAANNAELLRRLAGRVAEERRAQYRCCVAYVAASGAEPVIFEGKCTGTIVEQPRGTGGFGYDPLFFSDELHQTFGEATPADKHAVSHRGRAFRAFAEWLLGRMSGSG